MDLINLNKIIKEPQVRLLFTEAFSNPKILKFYRLLMLDQDKKIREYAFESFSKILVIDEQVSEQAKKEKIHLVLAYSLGRD